jgi:hypothetical protein
VNRVTFTRPPKALRRANLARAVGLLLTLADVLEPQSGFGPARLDLEVAARDLQPSLRAAGIPA